MMPEKNQMEHYTNARWLAALRTLSKTQRNALMEARLNGTPAGNVLRCSEVVAVALSQRSLACPMKNGLRKVIGWKLTPKGVIAADRLMAMEKAP
jgi:hypothetical protein